MNDFRLAVRTLAKSPATTFVVVVTLAVTVATAAIIASTIDAVWHIIPATRTDRLVFVASTDPRPGQSQAGYPGVSRGPACRFPISWTGQSERQPSRNLRDSRSAPRVSLDWTPLNASCRFVLPKIFWTSGEFGRPWAEIRGRKKCASAQNVS